jgi:hypothetical protein
VQFQFTHMTADPLLAGSSFMSSYSIGMTFDRPKVGFTTDQLKAGFTTLSTWLAANSGENVTKFIGGES